MDEVIQADRDAAANALSIPIPGHMGATNVRKGMWDNHDFVQAFRQHRLSALRSKPEREPDAEALRKSLIAAERALREAHTIFYNYGQLHRAKGNTEGDEKAKRNEEFADRMDAAACQARAALTQSGGER